MKCQFCNANLKNCSQRVMAECFKGQLLAKQKKTSEMVQSYINFIKKLIDMPEYEYRLSLRWHKFPINENYKDDNFIWKLSKINKTVCYITCDTTNMIDYVNKLYYYTKKKKQDFFVVSADEVPANNYELMIYVDFGNEKKLQTIKILKQLQDRISNYKSTIILTKYEPDYYEEKKKTNIFTRNWDEIHLFNPPNIKEKKLKELAYV